ncbi:alpha carbonic anhydrase 1, chloroplastic-like [Punica granatum]|uniref:Carbonic anhydrase n=1 Tax=Punica granatum TaxID=22663 RepID=A0A218X3J9_PUNGR|nr:alpha carbonic anhydrase 1, chloroplastic-like [Punica granatum]OWM79081.1 hypothetical protein CDL15_Pgr003252 [Punica granatum]
MAAPLGLFSVFAFALLLATASASFPEAREAFSYSGDRGPSHWGHLSSEYSACSNGKIQSPVNVIKNQMVLNKDLTPLTQDYHPANATLGNNGVSIAINFEEEVGALMVGNKKYSLKQMHWHTPSEHYLDGVQYAAEMHLLHQTNDGSIAVAAVLYNYGEPDPILQKIDKVLVQLGQESSGLGKESHIALGLFNPKDIISSTSKYYRYIGSTTTPPCIENVIWSILGEVRTISEEQVQTLRAPLNSDSKSNCRPVQPLNGRQIELYEAL